MQIVLFIYETCLVITDRGRADAWVDLEVLSQIEGFLRKYNYDKQTGSNKYNGMDHNKLLLKILKFLWI